MKSWPETTRLSTTATLLALVGLLAGCTVVTTVGEFPGPPQPDGGGGPITLSASDQLQLCADSARFFTGSIPTPAPTATQTGCNYNDVDIGGEGSCCGGDLRTQRCSEGLICSNPGSSKASRVGRCSKATDTLAPVCIGLNQPIVLSVPCELTTSNAPGSCSITTDCGSQSERVACTAETCTCFHDSVVYSTYPATNDDCDQDFPLAFSLAVTKCGVSRHYTGTQRTSW